MGKIELLKAAADDSYIHPYSDVYDLPTTYELSFPIDISLKEGLEDLFGEATSNLANLSNESVSSLFLDHANSLKNNSLRNAYSATIEVFVPQSLVFSENESHIRCVSKETEERHSAHLLINPKSLIKESDFEKISFGLREDFYAEGGSFTAFDSKQETIFENSTSLPKEWMDSREIFVTSTGESIILNKDSRLGWYRMQSNSLGIMNVSLDEFIQGFLDHVIDRGWHYSRTQKKVLHPLDSYSTHFEIDFF